MIGAFIPGHNRDFYRPDRNSSNRASSRAAPSPFFPLIRKILGMERTCRWYFHAGTFISSFSCRLDSQSAAHFSSLLQRFTRTTSGQDHFSYLHPRHPVNHKKILADEDIKEKWMRPWRAFLVLFGARMTGHQKIRGHLLLNTSVVFFYVLTGDQVTSDDRIFFSCAPQETDHAPSTYRS